MKMKVGMIAAVAMAVLLCGCGKSNSAPAKPSKAEVRDYIIRKWTKIGSEDQVRAAFVLDTQFRAGSGNTTSFLLTVQKHGLGDEFEKDMNLWQSCGGAD